jgi:hypothetical protein
MPCTKVTAAGIIVIYVWHLPPCRARRKLAMFMCLTEGGDDSSYKQFTRTSATYFRDNGKLYAAFDDCHSFHTDNLVHCGFQMRKTPHGAIPHAKYQKKIDLMLERAEKDHRIVSSDRMSSHVRAVNFDHHGLGRAIFGRFAGEYANYLHRNFSIRIMALPTPSEKILDKLNGYLVCHVLLGGYRTTGSDDIGFIYLNGNFVSDKAYGRAVVRQPKFL